MALLKVLREPDPRLRKISQPVEKVTPEIVQLLDDMLETMQHEDGIGLAAPQVNVLKRVIVMECPLFDPLDEKCSKKDAETVLLKLINPVITSKSDEMIEIKEACLSVPGEAVSIPRSRFITLTYLDEHGKNQTLKADSLLSICIQHEIDHLDGKLIIDSLSAFKKKVVLQRLKKRKESSLLI
jgi:peptide deformylase